MKVTILDGYIDEPSRLGVPPFISPYPRYVWGAILDAGHEPEYMTIDKWRQGARPSGELLFMIRGAVVPGKYLRSMPMSEREAGTILSDFRGERIVWHSAKPAGPESKIHIWGCDPDAFIFDLLDGGNGTRRRRTREEWARWSVSGAEAIRSHQDCPQPLISEVDVSYGCPHYINGGCSFCTEPLYGRPVFRGSEEVIDEVKALLKAGCTNFRLGGQSCTLSYMADGIGETPVPRPNVGALSTLFRGLASLPGIRVLHTDNADPSVIAAHPEDAERALEIIASTCTSGNVLSLGMESADPAVIEKNNLNSTPEQVMVAIRMMNKVGAARGSTGLPKLLPGLNMLAGLEGETRETFELNRTFLDSVVSSDLLLRRINIRQVAPTRRDFPDARNRKHFIRFKEYVRENIDPALLRRVAPSGTVLKDAYTEMMIGKLMFARQIGSYPLLIGIPQNLEPGQFIDVMITYHGSRSLTALEYPLDINKCPIRTLEAIPGVGKKRAARLFNSRPMNSSEDILQAVADQESAEIIARHAGF